MLCLLYFFVFSFSLAFGFPSNDKNHESVERDQLQGFPISLDRVEQRCPEQEHWDHCYAHCQHNCSNWGQPIPCNRTCVAGCVCDDGYVRGPDNKCIIPNECRNLQTYFTFDKIDNIENSCSDDEHWDPRYSHCQHNCSNWGQPISCSRHYVPGCVCDRGYVRGPENKCVSPNTCTELQHYFADEETIHDSEGNKCPTKEHWVWCSANCQMNCTNKDDSFICPEECVSGCVCNAGFVRNSDGKCILPRMCPSFDEDAQQDSHNCPQNQHWSSCNRHCGKNCTNYDKPVPCPSDCISGCICNNGYVWGPDGDCILTSQCPNKNLLNSLETDDFCPPNENFSPCFAHCQRNCSNWSDHTLTCQKICAPGCTCINGMVRSPHGDCISPRQCPPRDALKNLIPDEIICPVDEHFERCRAHCQINCSNWNQKTDCKMVCIPGCVCDKGYVRSPTGRCITVEKCPSPAELLLWEMENMDLCPKHEHKSKYQAHRNSDKYCVYESGSIDICPPTYLRGCVCDEGLARGTDNLCVPSRFLPNANELDFMQVIPEIEDDCVDSNEHPRNHLVDVQLSSSESQEDVEKHNYLNFVKPFDQHPNTLSESEGNLEPHTVDDSTPELIDPDLKRAPTGQEYNEGCPDEALCTAACRREGRRYGTCTGARNRQCVCF